MIEGIAKDKRLEFANQMRQFADMVEKQDRQPMGARFYVFLDDHTIMTCAKDDQLMDFYKVAGIFLREAIMSIGKSTTTPVKQDDQKST